MTLGFVIGESKPTIVTGQTSRSLPIGEYVIINSTEGKIVGLVEKSVVSSAALGDVSNYDETLESIEVAALNKRDKSHTAMIRILGFLESLQKGKAILPAIPPTPGTEIIKATKEDLGQIFGPENEECIKIGGLLRNPEIDSQINLNKIVSRLLEADTLSDVLEIREGADIQQRVLRLAFTPEVKESANFWEALDQQVQYIGANPDRKEDRHSADRVQDKIDDARHRTSEILDPDMSNPVALIKEGRLNILNVSEFTDRQANVALAYYLQELLADRKAAVNAKGGKVKSKRSYRFNTPIFVIIEEAHVFIPKNEDAKAKYWAAKIAREGRKFGLGLGIVSQRPRDIEANVLSQMGSLAVMKIVQEDDQRQIASAAESISREFIAQLTSLNIGDAVLVGQWVNLPAIVHIDEMKGKKIGSDQNAVGEWAVAKKIDNAGTNSSQDLVQKDLLMD